MVGKDIIGAFSMWNLGCLYLQLNEDHLFAYVQLKSSHPSTEMQRQET